MKMRRRNYLKRGPRARKVIPRSPIKRKPRPVSETLRIYGSPGRRKWVTQQPCVFCGAEPYEGHPSHNAHTEVGGLSHKAHYTTIVPACASCHTLFDNHDLQLLDDRYARQTEARWQASLQSQPSKRK